jgi:hypothetical protein
MFQLLEPRHEKSGASYALSFGRSYFTEDLMMVISKLHGQLLDPIVYKWILRKYTII